MKEPLLLPELSESPATCRGGRASLSGAVFNISTSIIGAGIMSIPAAMRVLGVVPLVVLIAAVAVLFDYTVEFLLRYSGSPADASVTSYAGVMRESFGPAGSVALQLCIAVTNAGCLVSYLIVIGDVMSGSLTVNDGGDGATHTGVLQDWFGQQWWAERPMAILVILVFILLPLCLLRRIDSLRFSSAFAVFLAVVFMGITSYVAIYALIHGGTQTPRLLPDLRKEPFYQLFTAVPVIVVAFTFHFNIHPIRSELSPASDMKTAVRLSLLLCSVIYATVGFFGYLLFGDTTMPDILSNFGRSSGTGFVSPALDDAIRLSYALHLVLVFPVLLFSLRLNVDQLVFHKSHQSLADDPVRFLSLTGIILVFSYLGAIVIPDLWTLFQFFGSTTAVCLSLVFPGALILRDIHGVSAKSEKVLASIMISLAVITSSAAIASNIVDYIS